MTSKAAILALLSIWGVGAATTLPLRAESDAVPAVVLPDMSGPLLPRLVEVEAQDAHNAPARADLARIEAHVTGGTKPAAKAAAAGDTRGPKPPAATGAGERTSKGKPRKRR